MRCVVFVCGGLRAHQWTPMRAELPAAFGSVNRSLVSRKVDTTNQPTKWVCHASRASRDLEISNFKNDSRTLNPSTEFRVLAFGIPANSQVKEKLSMFFFLAPHFSSNTQYIAHCFDVFTLIWAPLWITSNSYFTLFYQDNGSTSLAPLAFRALILGLGNLGDFRPPLSFTHSPDT